MQKFGKKLLNLNGITKSMTTPSNGEKSLGQIAYEEREKWSLVHFPKSLFMPWSDLPEWEREAEEKMAQAVAQHAIATSPLVKQLVDLVNAIQPVNDGCLADDVMVRNRPMNWYDARDEALSEAYAAIGNEGGK